METISDTGKKTTEKRRFYTGHSHKFSDLVAVCPSELVDAFTHNRPLIEVERQAIEGHRKQASSEILWRTKIISAIDVRGEDVKDQRERLVQEAVTISTMLTICKRLEAPIRNVPFDVLQAIAVHSFEPDPGPTFVQFKAVFGQVCSAWREAVVSSPQLWTTLFITMGAPASLNESRVIEWLERAKGRPITLYIDFNKPSRGWDSFDRLNKPPLPIVLPDDAVRFFKSISSHLTHLSHLGVRTHDMKLLRSVLDMPFVWKASELQHLDIRSYYSYDFYQDEIQDQKGSLQLFQTHPPLTRLTMELLPHITSGGSLKHLDNFVQWSNLTYLRIYGPIEMPECIHVLKLSPNVHTASFCLDIDFNNLPPPGALVHSNLKILALVLLPRCNRVALHDLLQMIQFPNLVGLDIVRNNMDRYPRDDPPDRPANDYPVVNSLGEFKHLQMLGLHFSHEENFKPLLDRAPNLQFLAINMFNKFSYDLFQHVSYPDTVPGHILRHLVFLYIQYDSLLGHQAEAAIVNTIMSRHRINESLPPEERSALDTVVVRVGESREQYGRILRSSINALIDLAKKCEEVGIEVHILPAILEREFNFHAMPHVNSFDDLKLRSGSMFD